MTHKQDRSIHLQPGPFSAQAVDVKTAAVTVSSVRGFDRSQLLLPLIMLTTPLGVGLGF